MLSFKCAGLRRYGLYLLRTASRSSRSLKEELKAQGLEKEVNVIRTGCFGLCALGPIMVVYPEGAFYSRVKP